MKHPANRHHARAEAYLRRAGYSEPAASTAGPQRPREDTELPVVREESMAFAGRAQRYEGPIDRGTPRITGGRLSRDNPEEPVMAARARGTYRDSPEMIRQGSEDGESRFPQGHEE